MSASPRIMSTALAATVAVPLLLGGAPGLAGSSRSELLTPADLGKGWQKYRSPNQDECPGVKASREYHVGLTDGVSTVDEHLYDEPTRAAGRKAYRQLARCVKQTSAAEGVAIGKGKKLALGDAGRMWSKRDGGVRLHMVLVRKHHDAALLPMAGVDFSKGHAMDIAKKAVKKLD